MPVAIKHRSGRPRSVVTRLIFGPSLQLTGRIPLLNNIFHVSAVHELGLSFMYSTNIDRVSTDSQSPRFWAQCLAHQRGSHIKGRVGGFPVCSGCYNSILCSWHQIFDKPSFLSFNPDRLTVTVPADVVSGKGCCLVHRWYLHTVSLQGGRDKACDPIHEVPLWPSHLAKTTAANTITMGLVLIYESRGDIVRL